MLKLLKFIDPNLLYQIIIGDDTHIREEVSYKFDQDVTSSPLKMIIQGSNRIKLAL